MGLNSPNKYFDVAGGKEETHQAKRNKVEKHLEVCCLQGKAPNIFLAQQKAIKLPVVRLALTYC